MEGIHPAFSQHHRILWHCNVTLAISIARSRSCLCTLGPKLSIIYVLGSPGYGHAGFSTINNRDADLGDHAPVVGSLLRQPEDGGPHGVEQR